MNRFQLIYGTGEKSNYNAGSKAITDATYIAKEVGYKKFAFVKRSSNKIVNICRLIGGLIKCYLFSNDIFIQYPISNAPRLDKFVSKIFFRLPRKKTTILVHDLNSYRFTGILNKTEIDILKYANNLIVHSQAMKNLLIAHGIQGKRIKILDLFPYLIKIPNGIDRRQYNEIVFAGNLDKSEFLKQLITFAVDHNINFNLYGSETSKITYNNNVKYMGRFSPEDISSIKGKWGLVWDGNSIETCSGELGNYMEINSPHKVSLYLAAQLPLIIWKGSALASFVTENKLGIAIDSLKDLIKTIDTISDKEYEIILENVKNISTTIINGISLKDNLKNPQY